MANLDLMHPYPVPLPKVDMSQVDLMHPYPVPDPAAIISNSLLFIAVIMLLMGIVLILRDLERRLGNWHSRRAQHRRQKTAAKTASAARPTHQHRLQDLFSHNQTVTPPAPSGTPVITMERRTGLPVIYRLNKVKLNSDDIGLDLTNIKPLLDAGWQPFAVDNGNMYFSIAVVAEPVTLAPTAVPAAA